MAKGGFFEKVEKLKTVHRVLILAGTVAFLAGPFLYFIYMPKTEEIGRLRQEIAGLQQQIDRAKAAAARLPELEEKEARIREEFQHALRLLPNQKEIPALLKGLTRLGAEANLEFRLFSPQSERDRGFYYEIPVAMELSGMYHDVAVFFNHVGNMERIVNISNVSMKPQKANSTMLVTQCEAVTYRFKEGAHEQPKERPAPQRRR